MKRYYSASVQVIGFVRMEVVASSVEEAKEKMRHSVHREELGNLESPVVESFEADPEPGAQA